MRVISGRAGDYVKAAGKNQSFFLHVIFTPRPLEIVRKLGKAKSSSARVIRLWNARFDLLIKLSLHRFLGQLLKVEDTRRAVNRG